MDTELELAWAAGFFDGEGCSKHYMTLSVGQKDRRPLDRFAAAVGYGNVTGPYLHGHKKNGDPIYCHHWEVSGQKAVAVLRKLWPYLSEPKREQIKSLPSVFKIKPSEIAA